MSLPKTWLKHGKVVPRHAGAIILDYLWNSGKQLTAQDICRHLRKYSVDTIKRSLFYLELAGFVENIDWKYKALRPLPTPPKPKAKEKKPKKEKHSSPPVLKKVEENDPPSSDPPSGWFRQAGETISDIRGNRAQIVRVVNSISVVISKNSTNP